MKKDGEHHKLKRVLDSIAGLFFLGGAVLIVYGAVVPNGKVVFIGFVFIAAAIILAFVTSANWEEPLDKGSVWSFAEDAESHFDPDALVIIESVGDDGELDLRILGDCVGNWGNAPQFYQELKQLDCKGFRARIAKGELNRIGHTW